MKREAGSGSIRKPSAAGADSRCRSLAGGAWRRPPAGRQPARHARLPGALYVAALCAVIVFAALALGSCGNPPATSTTAASTTTSGGQPPNGSQPGGSTQPSVASSIPVSPGTTVAEPTGTSGGSIPATTIFTGTTVGGVGSTFTLTFVGPVSTDTWKALRALVIRVAGEGDSVDSGQRVRDEVAKLAAGPTVGVGSVELDSFSGIGFAAGAGASQPIAVAVGDDGHQVIVYAFTVPGKPDATTIAGFDRVTKLVEMVEGPLPINSSTQNITTIPSAP
jgi:hypothetical protein